MIRTTRPGRGAVGHLAGLDSLRQLPGDAARRAAPGGDGPGRTVALTSIRGTVQRRVKEGWRVVEGGLRLRLVPGIAPGPRGPLCSLQPAPIRTTRPGRDAVAHLAGLDSLRQLCQAMRSGGPHLVAKVRAAPWPWRRSGAPFNEG